MALRRRPGWQPGTLDNEYGDVGRFMSKWIVI